MAATYRTNIKGEQIALEDRFLSGKEVEALVAFTRATMYRMMDNLCFPASYLISPNRVGWLASDIAEFKMLGHIAFKELYGEKLAHIKAEKAQAKAVQEAKNMQAAITVQLSAVA